MAERYGERISALEERANVVGAIIQCFLTEEQFKTQHADGWALCDGRSVEGSAYHKLGFGIHVPDCRGLFLRTLGGRSAALGQVQAQATAPNGLRTRHKIYDLLTGTIYLENPTPDSYYYFCHLISRSLAPSDTVRCSETDLAKMQGLDGDEETRPENISVNTFMYVG